MSELSTAPTVADPSCAVSAGCASDAVCATAGTCSNPTDDPSHTSSAAYTTMSATDAADVAEHDTTAPEVMPELNPRRMSDESCELIGGATFTRSTRPSVGFPNETLATYRWTPPPSTPVRARLLLVHGFRSHARYNFLASSPAALHVYGADASGAGDGKEGTDASEQVPHTSFVRMVCELGVEVHAHDHVGHGASTGLRAYFDSMDGLVSDVIAHGRELSEEGGHPVYMIGHSMGGTVAILASQQEPELFAGMMLSSAASEPPKNMLGLRGQLLARVSNLGAWLIPTMEVMPLPTNLRHPEMQALFESDSDNLIIGVRARVGHEFLQAYTTIASSLQKVTVPFLTMSGKHDTLVDPEASTRFYDGAASEDKEMQLVDCWHNILTEPNKEQSWEKYTSWLEQRLPAPTTT